MSQVEFSPLTGRSRQLRPHAAHERGLHCPIVGDLMYGTGKEGEQLMLHTTQYAFFHPATGERLCFTSRPAV